ncbi:hypothetical protein E2C01_092693 [Portunus trituberculatus]|uniref:Uncharacterized protein n=1 Tax=Portunus trituberculatus TaxID=210409 RepID=A0A5B7JKY2_PORTR|nr:hypothetical protein [Portunus trituberculatus]
MGYSGIPTLADIQADLVISEDDVSEEHYTPPVLHTYLTSTSIATSCHLHCSWLVSTYHTQ